MNLKVCPYSTVHRALGGYPDYVCSDCGTEWKVVECEGHKSVLYQHFDGNGNVKERWKVPLENGISPKRRRLSV